MSDPFLAEIKINAFSYAPKNWAQCNGQSIGISQNQALFALLGTTYGGDGVSYFNLPNLMGRVPMHAGNNHVAGEVGGEVTHQLSYTEIPSHIHSVNVSTQPATTPNPGSNTVLAASTQQNAYAPYANPQPMISGALATQGSNQPHLNMQPFLTLNFCIALAGVFPSRN